MKNKAINSSQHSLVSVIVPTYCEGENLSELTQRIATTFAKTDYRYEILIIDDNSPDQTQSICKDLANKHPLHLHVRKTDRGLSSAVLHGLNNARGDFLMVMDADLSHPPEKIPELLDTLSSKNADFAIGSRYAKGGSTAADWGIFRWINSFIATLLARPFTKAHDPMSGFFALKRSTFQKASSVDPIGYKIGLELLVKCHCKKIVEVPIHFEQRKKGASKLTLKEQFNYLRHIRRLSNFRFGNFSYFVQFGAIGLSGMFVDLFTFSLLLGITASEIARFLAVWVAMTWNFALNKYIAFSFAKRDPFFSQYVKFCGSCLLGGMVNWGISVLLWQNTLFFEQNKVIAAAIGVIAGSVFNFFISRYMVFKQ